MATYNITVTSDSIVSYKFTGSDKFGQLDTDADNQQISLSPGDNITFTFDNLCDNPFVVHAGDQATSDILTRMSGGKCTGNTSVTLSFPNVGDYLYRSLTLPNVDGYISVSQPNNSVTPTPTPTPGISVTPTPTVTVTPSPTPALLTHRTHVVQLRFDSNFGYPRIDEPSDRGIIDKTLLTDTDTNSPENMVVAGVVSRIFYLTNNLDSFNTDFLIDKRPDANNIRYLNSNPNLVYSHKDTHLIAGFDAKTSPDSILPRGSAELNNHRETFHPTYPSAKILKCNLSVPAYKGYKFLSAFFNGHTSFSRNELSRYLGLVYAPRLKTGLTIMDRVRDLPLMSITDPSEISLIHDNIVLGGTYRGDSWEVVSSAYHYRSNTIFAAAIDSSGNGRIVALDAATRGRVQFTEIIIPNEAQEDGSVISRVDKLFEIYIKDAHSLEDKLFVNFASKSAKGGSVRVYDLSNLTTKVVPQATPTPTPTITITPTVTPTISVTPTITGTVPLTPTVTPTITLTPSVTPTNIPEKFRYTRKTLVLDNLVPCNKYRLKLELSSPQYGTTQIQILDINDLGKNQFDNVIEFESRNLQKYFRAENSRDLSSAYDDKVYQAITYTVYHATTIDTFILKYTLTNLHSGKVITETRVLDCDDKVECDEPRVECLDQDIKKIIQKPDGTFRVYVGLSDIPTFRTLDDFKAWINTNKCCDFQYKVGEGADWITAPKNIVSACEPSVELIATIKSNIQVTPTPTSTLSDGFIGDPSPPPAVSPPPPAISPPPVSPPPASPPPDYEGSPYSY